MTSNCAGQRIKQLRELKGYTREILAEKAEISSKYLYEIELGKRKFSAAILSRIAKSLSVSCDYIMFGFDVTMSWEDKAGILMESIDPKELKLISEVIECLRYLYVDGHE